jgi:signal transduction histidine kinase
VNTAVAPTALEPSVVTEDSSDALLRAAHGEEGLRILREIGFGSLLVVPLVVRARVEGTITFVSPKGDPPFTSDEIGLAVDLGARCAMALESARLYREADLLRLAAETANRSKSQFLRTISHELRTPLNAIGGFAELIELGIEGPVTEKQRDALARIKTNQRHLLKLITEILNFVRVESGRLEYRLGRVSLTKVLADVGAMLSGAAEQKKLKLVTAPRERTRRSSLGPDPDRVRQILLNLVMNALKYTPAGGDNHHVLRERRWQCRRPGRRHGSRHRAEATESIFEPFVQLSAGLTDQSGGVGLGLAISRDLARAMQGDVTGGERLGQRVALHLVVASIVKRRFAAADGCAVPRRRRSEPASVGRTTGD